MAKKVRRDNRGRVLKKGETYRNDRDLYCYSYTNALGKRKFIYASDLPLLREKEKKIQRDKLDGLDIYLMSKATINYVFDLYMDTKTNLRESTKANYTYMYDRFVRPGFGKNLISDIKYSDVVKFYQALLDSGMQVNTLDTIHTVLHPTFRLAVRDDIIRSNPTDGAMTELKRKMKRYSGVKHALTKEQQEKFFQYLEETPDAACWRPLLTVMFGTGCRIGEIVGLRWQDIDMDRNEININHTITYYPRIEDTYRCEFKANFPKTEAGIRVVPMLEKVKEAFLLEREYQSEHGNFNMAIVDGLEDFIFSNRFCNIHNPAGVNRAIKRLVDDCNAKEMLKARRENREPVIVPRFSTHIARHTFCSRLCENDVNIKVIQSIMGHKDIQTTLDIYAEISDGKKQEILTNLEDKNIL